jgi:hypothetical protein
MILLGVTAQQEAVVFQHVGQGQGQRRDVGRGAGHDTVGARAGQQRADGQAQLVQQAGGDELAQQARPAFGEHPLVTTLGQRVHGRFQVHGIRARHDDIGPFGELGAAPGRRLGGGDDDRAGVRRGRGDQAAARVEVEPGGDHRDRRRRRPAFPQVAPELARAHRRVPLGPYGRGAHHDDVSQRAQ